MTQREIRRELNRRPGTTLRLVPFGYNPEQYGAEIKHCGVGGKIVVLFHGAGKTPYLAMRNMRKRDINLDD